MRLNVDDYHGVIKLKRSINRNGETTATIDLYSTNGDKISHKSGSQEVTMYMSVLFAIGKLSGERDKSEYPLIFDAPTSSFTDAKESEFFNVISRLNKQVIIVTKSFLKESSSGEDVLDRSKVDAITGRVFRIELKKPFDRKKLGTLQTLISKIK